MTVEEVFRSSERYLGASIELTSGAHVVLSKRPGSSIQGLPPCLWWKQIFTVGRRTGELAIGVADTLWTSLFDSVDGDRAAMKEILFEAFNQTALRILDDVQHAIGVSVAAVRSGESSMPAAADGCLRLLYAQCDEPAASGDLIIAIDGLLKDLLLMDMPNNGKSAETAAALPECRESLGKLSAALTNGKNDPESIANRLLDLPLPVSIRIAQTSIPIKDVLRLTPGSVVELGKYAGEPVDIVVHGAVLAKGEIVSIKGYYGVRVTEIVAVSQRLAAVNAAEATESGRFASLVDA
jgi:flagellar motor switch protein FliN/FliY